MIVASIVAAARSPLGRLATVAAGIAGLGLIVHGIGLAVVTRTLAGAARGFPLVLALEVAQLACTMRALRSLYGPAGRAVPAAQLVRAGLIGYAVMGLVPAGRAVAEVTRASLLARYVGAGRAAAAAGRMQAVALLANALVSVPAALAAWLAVGTSWLPLAIAGNFLVTLVLGAGVLVTARRSRIGAWIGRCVPSARGFGEDLDEALEREPMVPRAALAWECGGRGLQVAQNGVIIASIGGALRLGSALSSEGIHLVGSPGTELEFAL